MSPTRAKVYEIAKEFKLDPQRVVEVVRRLGIDVKSQMSVLGTEEMRQVKEHLRKSRPAPRAKAVGTTATKTPFVEKTSGRKGHQTTRETKICRSLCG